MRALVTGGAGFIGSHVAEALAAARVAEMSEPTLAEGESLDDLRNATYDRDALAERGLGFERLDQLAMEHLLGVR